MGLDVSLGLVPFNLPTGWAVLAQEPVLQSYLRACMRLQVALSRLNTNELTAENWTPLEERCYYYPYQ